MQVRRRITLEVAHPGLLFAGIVTVVLVLDQLVKAAIRLSFEPGESISLIGNVLRLTYVRNLGAAFGLMPGQRSLFLMTAALVALCVTVYMVIAKPRSGWLVVSLAFIASGATGNLIDRLLFGRVTDFIDVLGDLFPVFNVADSAIVVGVAMLVVWILFVPDAEDEVDDGIPTIDDDVSRFDRDGSSPVSPHTES